MTLAFLGEKKYINSCKEDVLKSMKEMAKNRKSSIKGCINGIGVFSGEDSDGKRPLYACLDCPDLPEFRQKIVESLNKIKGISVVSNHGYSPHCTLAYLPKGEKIPPLDVPVIDIEFDTLAISWGDEGYKYKLGG